jgi:RimJ/RimL family protein N-acetyltransferase
MLRPATDDDLAAMLTWRNQATNREVSIHSHVIAPEEHRAWWDRVQDDPSRSVLVFEVDGRALGVVTFFDVTADSAGWGFYLDAETLGAEGTIMIAWVKIMTEAVDHAFGELGIETLAGEVLERNEAVRLMNRRFGFKEGSPEQRTVDGQTITVIPITLLRSERPARKKTR